MLEASASVAARARVLAGRRRGARGMIAADSSPLDEGRQVASGKLRSQRLHAQVPVVSEQHHLAHSANYFRRLSAIVPACIAVERDVGLVSVQAERGGEHAVVVGGGAPPTRALSRSPSSSVITTTGTASV